MHSTQTDKNPQAPHPYKKKKKKKALAKLNQLQTPPILLKQKRANL